ncbi:sugar transferase [Candidatus Roizmanbacteria bacterium]|nr:sugar transferase [Candidatus Roizmanbacteria bacterium]
MEQLIALILLVLFSPLFLILFFLVKLTSQGPFIFKQKRLGKDKKPFFIYKIRTMVVGAENLKSNKIQNLNEADGPVFKIHNDPRYTKFGRFLAHSGLDEIPQLGNIVKGEMAFVGPRPLPVDEANKVPKIYERRFSVLPGLSSLWVIKGTNHSSFKKWMELDLEYVKNKSFWYDLKITIKTIWLLIRLVIK